MNTLSSEDERGKCRTNEVRIRQIQNLYTELFLLSLAVTRAQAGADGCRQEGQAGSVRAGRPAG